MPTLDPPASSDSARLNPSSTSQPGTLGVVSPKCHTVDNASIVFEPDIRECHASCAPDAEMRLLDQSLYHTNWIVRNLKAVHLSEVLARQCQLYENVSKARRR